MKKIICHLLVAPLIFVSFSRLTQSNFSCGSLIPNEKYVNLDDIHKYRAEEIKLIQQGVSQNRQSGDSLLVIPIVFHIVHEYGTENISDAQIEDAVRILNEDYQKQNSDTATVVSPFNTIIGDAEIEFRLAKIDPHGNCTNGIDRIYSQETTVGDDGSKMHVWPRSRYLNVWVVKSMQNGVAGYAYYPSATISGYGAYIDGVIILSNYIGSIGTSNATRSRALTHEIGHYLALSHTWGDNNNPGVACGDDGVSDTPETKGWTTCVLTGNDVCNPGVDENIQNFMEYSYCSHMFTAEQVANMRTVLHLPTALRDNLWSPSNLIATGVEDSHVDELCVPIAEFHPEKQTICLGETITLYDNSYNGDADTWSWSISGGTPSTSADQNPDITFNTAGWNTISLTVSNASGSDTYTLSKAVYVSPDYDIHSGTYVETFENLNNQNVYDYYPSSNNANENEEIPYVIFAGGTVNVADWELATNAGYSGNKSLRLDTYGANDNMTDEFITPNYDLTYVSGGELTFAYSAAVTSSTVENITASLKIYSSINCGTTWQLRDQITDLELANAGLSGNYFIPTTSAQWTVHTVSLPPSLQTSNVRFKFEYTSSSASNNIYVDDIGVTGVLASSSITGGYNLSVYPNPAGTEGTIMVHYSSDHGGEISLEITNAMGQKIAQRTGVVTSAGSNYFELNQFINTPLSKGVYFIKIESEQHTALIKTLLIQ